MKKAECKYFLKVASLFIFIIATLANCTNKQKMEEKLYNFEESNSEFKVENNKYANNPDLEVLKTNEKYIGGGSVIMISDSPENKFIGHIDYRSVDYSSNIFHVWAYEKYIIIETQSNDNVPSNSLYTIYKFNKNYRFSEYSKNGEKILEIQYRDATPYGIYDKYLFQVVIGIGINMEFINIETGEIIFEGVWNRKEIEFIDEKNIVVYKIKEKPIYVEETGKYLWTMYAYSLNLYTKELVDLNKSIEKTTD
jgi:hypothetical protein